MPAIRLTGGRYQRCPVACPPGKIRPAMARMRESLFSILSPDITGLSFLDLFSGSGLMAIEAASRGAGVITLVESDRGKRNTIKQNLQLLKNNEIVHFYSENVERFLQRRPNNDYDIIFLDPPFDYADKAKLLPLLLDRRWLRPQGLVLIHHPRQELLANSLTGPHGRLVQTTTKLYGGSKVDFYRFDPLQQTIGE